MADCDFTVGLDAASRTPKKAGDQFTVSMSPELGPSCTLNVSIDGNSVTMGTQIGDVKVVRLGAKGQVTLEALKDSPKAKVSFTVQCEVPACGPTTRDYLLGSAPVVIAPRPATAPEALPECGDDCFVIDYIFKSRAETYTEDAAHGGETHEMPKENSPVYNFAFYPGMRGAFDAAVKQRYKAFSKGCSKDCECQKNKNEKPTATTWWEEEISATYTFPDGSGTLTITGNVKLRLIKTPGTCRPRTSKEKKLAMLPPQLRRRLLELPEDEWPA